MPIFNFLISGLVAYLNHQAVQPIGSTAFDTDCIMSLYVLFYSRIELSSIFMLFFEGDELLPVCFLFVLSLIALTLPV